MGRSRLWFAFSLSLRGFTDRAVNALDAARAHAQARAQGAITPMHVLAGLATTAPGAAREVLERLGVSLEQHAPAITALADQAAPGPPTRRPRLHPETRLVLKRARAEARALGSRGLGTEHLVLGLLAGSGAAAAYLRGHGVTRDRFREELHAAAARR